MEKTIKRDFTIEDVAFLIMWATFFAPPVIGRVSNIASYVLTLTGYTVFLVMFLYRQKNISLSLDFMLFFTFVIYCVIIFLVKTPGELPRFVRRQLLPVIESVFLVRWTFENRKKGFSILYHVCAFYITANFVSLILFREGLVRSDLGSAIERAQWLFGSKNNIPLYMILFITIAACHYYTVRRSKSFYALVGMAAFSILMTGEDSFELLGGSSTGFVAYAVVLAMIAYYMYSERTQRATVGVKMVFILVLIMNFVILTGMNLPGMETLIVNVFHKTVTFTGRTLIWNANLKEAARHLIFGQGEEGVMAHVRINKEWVTTDYTYNCVLKLLLNYGFVGLGLFTAMILKIERGHETGDCILFAGFLGVMTIGLMNEVDLNWLLFFPAMLISSRVSLPPTRLGHARRIRVKPRRSLGLHVRF